MLKNILANWSNIFISAVAVFLLYPYFVGLLGEEQYGIWLLIVSITGYFALIQMGVPLTNVRYVSKYYAQGDYEKLNGVLGANLFLFSCMSVLTLIVGFGLSFILDSIFQIPPQYVKYAKVAMLLASLEIALRFVFEAVEGVLNARQEFVVINIVRNIIVVIRVALSFWLVTYNYGLIWIASLLLVSTVIQSVCFFLYVKIKYPQLKFVPHIASRAIFLEIFGYSGFVLLLQVASRISFQTDALVLASVVSVASVVWFGVANNMLLYLTRMIIGISKVLMPKISELDALGRSAEIKEHYLRVIRLTGFLVFPTCLALHLYGGDFIRLWMGDNYRDASSHVLSILALGYAFFLVQRGVGFPILMGTSKMKWPTIFMFLAALVNLLLSIWWGKLYGIVGVAWGTTIPTIIVSLVLMYYIANLLDIRIQSIAYQSLLLPTLSLIPFYVGYLIAEQVMNVPSYLSLLVRGSFAGSLCLFCIYFLLDKQDQNRVRTLLRRS